VAMTEMLDNAEEMGHVNVALSEAARGDTAMARLLRRMARTSASGDVIALEKPEHRGPAASDPEATSVLLLASGNVGLISFPQWQARMTLHQLLAAFPRLIPGLVDHAGIAFVMVDDALRGPLVVGSDGLIALRSGATEGRDPLAPFGETAAQHLLRTAGFRNAPDLLVMSTIDPVTGEAPAFEELVGHHGGLGGPQREPVLLHPTQLDPGDEPIVGAERLHVVLKGWIADAQCDTTAARC
jgi:hypothetical protein